MTDGQPLREVVRADPHCDHQRELGGPHLTGADTLGGRADQQALQVDQAEKADAEPGDEERQQRGEGASVPMVGVGECGVYRRGGLGDHIP